MKLIPVILFTLIVAAACQSCDLRSEFQASSGSRIIDITHSYREGLPEWDSFDKGLSKVVKQIQSIANGSMANVSEMKMVVHTGTHVDSPSHFLQDALLAGVDTTNALDLDILNGPVLVLDSPRETNITGNVVEKLILSGVKRILFRTLNTDRRLMWKPQFATDYTAITAEGAEYITTKTDIKLVGVDYLSVATYDDAAPTHKTLLSKRVILVEGLNLDDVTPGMYMLHCLPTKLVGSDGAPTRCILID